MSCVQAGTNPYASVKKTNALNLSPMPGQKLRSLREALHLTLRDVEAASCKIASQFNRPEFLIPHSRLFEIESRGTIPTIFRLYSVSVVYCSDYADLLRLYGVDLEMAATQLKFAAVPVTHTIETKLAVPMASPATRLVSPAQTVTVNLETALEQFEAVPAGVPAAGPRENRLIYTYVGLEDFTMYPLIMPGSMVQVDQSLRKIRCNGWRSEHERPIYVVETRQDGLRIGWCSLSQKELTVHPHPLSPTQVKRYCYLRDADIIGQVAAISTRLLSYQK